MQWSLVELTPSHAGIPPTLKISYKTKSNFQLGTSPWWDEAILPGTTASGIVIKKELVKYFYSSLTCIKD